MIIEVKSIPENFEKEKLGTKPCTIRQLDGHDILRIKNTKTNEVIERGITDISVWGDSIIISFRELP